jgi:sulfite oxidase
MLASQQLASDDGDNPNQPKCGNLIGTMQKLQDLIDQYPNLQHLRFESLDGMLASIDIIKALSPFGDVIIAYEMNDEPLTRDHGFPLRVIVPGYAAVRNVKWLSKLELAEEQAEGAWQRGLNYKVLPPSVLDAKEVDLDQMPGLGEVSVFSGITSVSRVTEGKKLVPGETVVVKARGWAWAGKFICCNGELLNRIKRQ